MGDEPCCCWLEARPAAALGHRERVRGAASASAAGGPSYRLDQPPPSPSLPAPWSPANDLPTYPSACQCPPRCLSLPGDDGVCGSGHGGLVQERDAEEAEEVHLHDHIITRTRTRRGRHKERQAGRQAMTTEVNQRRDHPHRGGPCMGKGERGQCGCVRRRSRLTMQMVHRMSMGKRWAWWPEGES